MHSVCNSPISNQTFSIINTVEVEVILGTYSFYSPGWQAGVCPDRRPLTVEGFVGRPSLDHFVQTLVLTVCFLGPRRLIVDVLGVDDGGFCLTHLRSLISLSRPGEAA